MSDADAVKPEGKPAGKQKPDKPKQDKAKQADKQADAGKQAEVHGHRPADERPSGPPRLQQYYREQVVARLKSDLKIDNLMQVPRIRDFRGVSPRAFDGQGNYSLGVKEQIIFPEIQYDQIDQVRGMDITITTTARDDRHGRALLEAFTFPFRK